MPYYVIESLIEAGESGTFDFIYVDGDKLNADVIYELSLKLLRTNGIIAFDNVSFESVKSATSVLVTGETNINNKAFLCSHK